MYEEDSLKKIKSRDYEEIILTVYREARFSQSDQDSGRGKWRTEEDVLLPLPRSRSRQDISLMATTINR